MSLSKDLVNIIKKTQETKTSPYDTQAEVVRVEGGTAWVHIPGGVDETPVRMTINARQGDTVQVRVANGTAFLVGNGSAPPTDDHKADIATNLAYKAQETAEEAVAGVDGVVQYFWHDANGAHITEIPQKEFVDNPSGSNLLAKSGGIALRNGTTDLAKFESNQIQLGRGPRGCVVITDSSLRYIPLWGESDFNYARQSGVTMTETFIGNGTTRAYPIFRFEEDSLTVKINGTVTSAYSTAFLNLNMSEGLLTFASAPAAGDVITFTYTTSWDNPYYSFGINNTINAPYGFAEGISNEVDGICAHAEGMDCSASGVFSHAQNFHTTASGEYQTAIGKYNVEDTANNFALIIGNGKSNSTRSDALEVTWDGDILMADDTDISAALTELGW